MKEINKGRNTVDSEMNLKQITEEVGFQLFRNKCFVVEKLEANLSIVISVDKNAFVMSNLNMYNTIYDFGEGR